MFHNIQPSFCPEDEDNPLGGSNEIAPQHTTISCPKDGDNPLGGSTTTYNHPLTSKMEKIYSEAVTRLLYNILTSIHMPPKWDLPYSEVATRLFAVGIFSTQRSICTFRYWDFPHLEMTTRHAHGFFSIILWDSKPSAVVFPSLRVSHSAIRIFPHKVPV